MHATLQPALSVGPLVPWSICPQVRQTFWSRATQLYTPLCRSIRPSVRPSVGPSVTLYFFFGFCGLWPHCSCPNDQVTSNTAPAHPHATGVVLYPALFQMRCTFSVISIFFSYNSPSFHQGPRLALSSKKSYGIS